MTTTSCFMCQPVSETDSGDQNTFCKNCEDSLKNPAFLQCSECNAIWGLADPGPLKHGIVLEPGLTYSTKSCCFCKGTELGSIDITGILPGAEISAKNKKINWMKPLFTSDLNIVKEFGRMKFKTLAASAYSTNKQLSIITDLIKQTQSNGSVVKSDKFYMWFTSTRKKQTQSKFSFVRI
jgi:hypothetical protein